MGKALELLVGQVTAPGATLTPLVMNAGNSLTIRSAAIDSQIHLLQVWNDNQTPGILRIKSPRLHDNVEGIRLFASASEVQALLPWQTREKLISQDTLVVELSGSVTAGDIETAALLIYYEELPGIDANLITPEELQTRMIHVMATENSLSLGTAGGYSGEEALNAEFNQFKANTPYAIMGYIVGQECAAIRWRGSDFGSLGLGGPGDADLHHITKDWFIRISMATDLPLIPVFQSENVDNVLIDGVQDEGGTNVTVSTICAELSQ